MSKKGQSKNDLKNLTYIAQKPAFLQNFGAPKRPSPPPGRGARDGREPLPERPRDGEWAGGSDEEGRGRGEESDDEWGDVYGGGGDDGPQVVVLKEGRHLTAEDVKRERRRAAGKKSESPPPPEPVTIESDTISSKPKTQLPPRIQSSAKRKLVGNDNDNDKDATSSAGKKDTSSGKKKKKGDKKLLSFEDDE